MARSKLGYVDMPESKSISCRKIENGFIVTESHSGPSGYSSKERFEPTKPKLEFETKSKGRSASKGPSSLSRAISVAKGRK